MPDKLGIQICKKLKWPSEAGRPPCVWVGDVRAPEPEEGMEWLLGEGDLGSGTVKDCAPQPWEARALRRAVDWQGSSWRVRLQKRSKEEGLGKTGPSAGLGLGQTGGR